MSRTRRRNCECSLNCVCSYRAAPPPPPRGPLCKHQYRAMLPFAGALVFSRSAVRKNAEKIVVEYKKMYMRVLSAVVVFVFLQVACDYTRLTSDTRRRSSSLRFPRRALRQSNNNNKKNHLRPRDSRRKSARAHPRR